MTVGSEPGRRARLREPAAKSALRAAYGLALSLQARIGAALPAGGGLRVLYGGARAGDVGGTRVKVQRLARAFPERRLGFNLVYLLSNTSYLPLPALRALKRRGVAMVHNQDGVFYPAWYGGDWQAQNRRMAASYLIADHVFWQSEFCRRAAARFLGEREGPGEVLYNAIDTEHFRPPGDRAGEGPFRFLLTGKIDEHLFYRVEASLRGLARARARGLDATLTLAGWFSAKAGAMSRELAGELGIADAVRLTGAYTQAEAPAIYGAADAYVMLKHNDPCPNAVIEALACGLPVLYAHSGGVPELVAEAAGVALPSEEDWERQRTPDTDAVADGMLRIAAERAPMAAAARARAVERFDIAPWIARHRAVFTRLVEGSE